MVYAPGNGNPQTGGQDRFDCPIRQHFGGPTSQFVNVFSQPGNYQVSLNLTGLPASNQPNNMAPRQIGYYTNTGSTMPPMAQPQNLTMTDVQRNGNGIMGPATPRPQNP